MAAPADVYQPCFCGSGKKLKFCCLSIADDALRIVQLMQNNQPQNALQAVEALEKKPIKEESSRTWLRITKARILSGMERFEESRALLGEILHDHPDNPEALAVAAMYDVMSQKLPAARDIVT